MALCEDKCQLAEDAAVIKSSMKKLEDAHSETQKIVNGMSVGFGVMSQKLDDYMDRGKDEHTVIFAKLKETVKWPHLLMVLTAISIIVGVTLKLSGG